MISEKAILLVDDDESIRTSLTYFFRKKTRCFQSVPTAEDALELLGKEPHWDAVISDFKLPGMDGITFLNHVKERLPRVKTALITAYATMDIVTEALRAGVHDFIPKPFKASMIADALKRMTAESAAVAEDAIVHSDGDESEKAATWSEDLEFTIQKVTHQLNNAFTALRGKAELGLQKASATERCNKFSEILDILSSVEALNKELMSFGKALTRQPFATLDIMALIRRRTFDHAALLHKAGTRLQIKNAEGDPLWVWTSQEPLTHILDNILINAIQGVAGVARDAKTVTVAVAPQGNQVLVRVTDNGVGMDRETLANACRNGFTTKQNGNGLGLFITQRLCRLIKAQLRIESTPGEGTSVTLVLPGRMEPAAHRDAERNVIAGAPS